MRFIGGIFYQILFCYYFLQLDVHVQDECPATEVQCEYKNLGCEAVVWTCFIFQFFYYYYFTISLSKFVEKE